MRYTLIILLIACFYPGFTTLQAQTSAPNRIIIIRHGEKPSEGDNLSCQGFNRAMQLRTVLNKKFGTPNQIYVPKINTGKSTSVARMYQTIVPFAVAYNLSINSKFDVDDTEGLTKVLTENSGTSLVVWEHDHISKIVKALGIMDVGKWPDSDYDTILVLSMKSGKWVLTRDHEGIQPSKDCHM